jgi:hypothetical protein
MDTPIGLHEWSNIRHFSPNEFRYPELLSLPFILFLDRVRNRVGTPFHITSDARFNNPGSLHYAARSDGRFCRAADFGIDYSNKTRVWETYAMIALHVQLVRMEGVELEIVHNPGTDLHVHLGLFLDDRPNRLIILPD